MARPGSRSRRSRAEEEEEEESSSRRGGRAAVKASKGPAPATLALGGGVVLALGLLIYMIAQPSEKKVQRKPVLAPVAVKKEEAPPPRPVLPTKVPPKPLTAEETAWVKGLFEKAQPHVDSFRSLSKQGWDLKAKEDNDGANAAWVKAQKEAREAIAIVSEALEDYEKFPPDRQDAYMSSWVSRLNGWVKERSQLNKVHDE